MSSTFAQQYRIWKRRIGREMSEKGSQPLRLKEWLLLQVDSGKYPGLRWESAEKTMFRIPWKHAAKQNYSEQEDAALFKAWAMYKGKFREGSIKMDASVWKTRLRCALNKSPDFQEVQENCQDLGIPYKLYRIVSETRERNGEGYREAPRSPKKEGSPRPPEEQQIVLMEDQKMESPPDKQTSPKLPRLENQKSPMEKGQFTGPVIWRNPHMDDKITDISESIIIPQSSSSSSDFWLHVRLYYHGKLVTEVTTQTAEGCRIVPLSSSQSDCNLGPTIPLEEIPLPCLQELPGFLPPDVHLGLMKLLLHLDKGVLLWVAPEGVFVKRQCQLRVYWSGPLALHTDRPNKLEREKTYKVLDTERFMHELQMYMTQSGPEPKYQIQLCFGEEFPEWAVNPKKLLKAHVEPVFARELLAKAKTKPRDPPSH